jgi:hypothetical protein
MSNKKETAVGWLQSEIDNKDMGEIPMWIYEFIEQAKKMEKQQMIEMHDKGFDAGLDFGLEEAVDYSLEYKEKKK